MRVVGRTQERGLSLAASGLLLKEGAVFNSEMQRWRATLHFPRGVFRYASHEAANQHWAEAQAASMAALYSDGHEQ